MARSLLIPVVVSLALHGAAVGMLLGLAGVREGIDLPVSERGRVAAMLMDIRPALAAAEVSYEAPAEVMATITARPTVVPAVARRGGVLRAIDTKGLLTAARAAASRWEAGVAGLVDRMPVPAVGEEERSEKAGETSAFPGTVVPGNREAGTGNSQPAPAAAARQSENAVPGTAQESSGSIRSAESHGPSGRGQGGISRGPGLMAGNVAPEYPEKSRRAGAVGTVMVHVVIGADGAVWSAVVGSSSGTVELDDAAVRAVRRWRFTPALEAGMAVGSEADVPVVFSLRR